MPEAATVTGDRALGSPAIRGSSALPARRTRLIGRERELARVRDQVLHGDRRLVTLTGAAGSGKTALALEAARQLAGAMPDGAHFVDLSVVRDHDAVAL